MQLPRYADARPFRTRKTSPGRHRDRCRCAAAPFDQGESVKRRCACPGYLISAPSGQKKATTSARGMIMSRRLRIHLTIGFLLATGTTSAQTGTFERDVLPIFTANCLSCHGGTSIYTQAGLDLRNINSVLRGSLNGPVIVKGSPEKSLLYQKVSTRSEERRVGKERRAGRLQYPQA